MTDTQLKCFLTVSQQLSFSKAAEILYVSQPAVSKSINALEDELGIALFDRQGKTISLTKAGELFRDFISEYDKALHSTLEHMTQLDGDIRSGNVTIGCSSTWSAAHFFTRLSRHFSIHYPGMQLDLLGLDPGNFLQALRDKDADVVIMYSIDVKKHPDIISVPLTSIGCGFMSSSLLPCKNPGQMSLEDLENETLMVVDSATEKSGKLIYSSLFTDISKTVLKDPKLRHCKNLASAQLIVSSGRGVMFSDSWTSAINNKEFHYYPLEQKIELSIAYLSSNKGSHVEFFAQEAARVFGEQF